MDVKIHAVDRELLKKYSAIPTSVEVNSALEIEVMQDGMGGFIFHERELDTPLVKYAEEDPNEIISWPETFDISNWAIVLAWEGEETIGGIVIACRNPELVNNRVLSGLDDLAIVWDIRVHPDHRRQGIGTTMFRKSIEWAKDKGYKQLSVETQNNNVPACKFYIKQGCRLGGINRYAYYHNPSYRQEIQLEWYFDLRKK